ncbi:MAG TPA: ribonuclease D [Alphaproteobacteria bacterium]
MNDSTLITDNKALAAFCDQIRHEPFLTIDTEFMRERTYYSQLCLIQIAGENAAAAIDPLAEGLDLAPVFEILRDPKVIKVFHAGKQDLEIFYRLMNGELPVNCFDTQIAAMALGYAEQIGFAALVDMVTGGKIDKTEQFTDWSRRPLRPSQLTYALSDVTELRPVYIHMQAELDRLNRMEWIQDQLDEFNDPDTYKSEPDEVWQKIKLRSHKPAPWLALKKIATWREHQAMHINRPRSFILKDDVLSQIALVCPKTVEELQGIRGIGGLAKSRSAEQIVALCNKALAEATPEDVPARDQNDRLNQSQEDQMDLLRLALKIMARQLKVVSRLLADTEDLTDFILKKSHSRLKTGWRWEAFGKQAQALLDGKAAIGVSGIYEV